MLLLLCVPGIGLEEILQQLKAMDWWTSPGRLLWGSWGLVFCSWYSLFGLDGKPKGKPKSVSGLKKDSPSWMLCEQKTFLGSLILVYGA